MSLRYLFYAPKLETRSASAHARFSTTTNITRHFTTQKTPQLPTNYSIAYKPVTVTESVGRGYDTHRLGKVW